SGKTVLEAEAARAAAIKADKDRRAQTRGMALAFKRLFIAMFAQQPDVLGDFALQAPKHAAKTAAGQAPAAVKAKATRDLLAPKGRRQTKEALQAAAAHVAPPPAPVAPQPAQPAPVPPKPAS